MPIPADGRCPLRLLWFDPHVLLCVEYSETGVIFLSIVATEHPQFALIESRSVILDLWCSADYWT